MGLNKSLEFEEFKEMFQLLGTLLNCDYIISYFYYIYTQEQVEEVLQISSKSTDLHLTSKTINYEILKKITETDQAYILNVVDVEALGIDIKSSVMIASIGKNSFVKGALAVVTEKDIGWNERDLEKFNKIMKQISEYYSLLEYKQYTDTIIESIDTAIFAVSTVGELVTFNRAAERILSCSSDWVIGKHYFNIMAYSEREKMRASVDYVLRTGNTWSGNFIEMVRLDGKVIYVNIIVCPWINKSGEIIGAIAVVTDETENKRFQDKLIRVEKMAVLGQIVEQMSYENDDLAALVKAAATGVEMTRNNMSEGNNSPAGIIGHSPSMKNIFKLIRKIALYDTTVLITGESGTGKTLLAHAIHDLSGRERFPFITVNCAALPENLLESELFGHEKGSFTGAVSSKKGKFELATKGTIFLDEISTLSLETQAKLLRVIQEKKFEKVGGERTIEVDVRIIAATNESLDVAVSRGTFREDLFYRLNVFSIEMPPLRERIEDIPELAAFFIRGFNKKIGKNIKGLNSPAMDLLINYAWPGNVRELQNVIERAMILEDDIEIGIGSLPINLQLNKNEADNGSLKKDIVSVIKGDIIGNIKKETLPEVPERNNSTVDSSAINLRLNKRAEYNGLSTECFKTTDVVKLGSAMEKAEKQILFEALEGTNGNRIKAANLLGISIRSLQYKLKKHGMIKLKD